MKYYKLNKETHEVSVVDSASITDEAFSYGQRRVADTRVGPLRVSTVFLPIDHSFGGGEPIVFETLVFGQDKDNKYTESMGGRYSTWDEAVAGHEKMVEEAKKLLKEMAKDDPGIILDRYED